MTRLTRSPFLRAFAALAIAIASVGTDVSHGLSHDDDRHRDSTPAALHSAGGAIEGDEHGSEHPHERVSKALRIRGELPDLVGVAAAIVVPELSAPAARPALPVTEPRVKGDRATGPPPRLRAPPLA